MSNQIKKIGILTSGGDAPGMNAAIRGVVRSAIDKNIQVLGFMRGYEGVINSDYIILNSQSVSDIIAKGGTILLSARSKEMMTDAGKEKAINVCRHLGIDALVVIGGDGSLTGALELSKRGINVIGIPGTIDLDLACSDYTIGFDTAVNTAMEAIDKIRDTSFSHERCSIIEVMGRNAGYIASWTAMANGAEQVLLPEKPEVSKEDIINAVKKNKEMGKLKNIIVLAEGYTNIDSHTLAKEIQENTGIETRATVLGHLQRGGTPTALERVHASIMGSCAVDSILKNEFNKIIVYKNGKYTSVDLQEGLNTTRKFDDTFYKLINIFAN